MDVNWTQEELEVQLSGKVAALLQRVGMLPEDVLPTAGEDQGLLEAFIRQMTTDERTQMLGNVSQKMRVSLCGCRAMGLGMYAAMLQGMLGVPVSQFPQEQIDTILQETSEMDPYDACLQLMGITEGSSEKKLLDSVWLSALEELRRQTGEDFAGQVPVRVYMRVLYAAGLAAGSR